MKKTIILLLAIITVVAMTCFGVGCKKTVTTETTTTATEATEEVTAVEETKEIANEYSLYTWSGAEGTQVSNMAKYWNDNFGPKYGFKVNVVQLGRDEFFTKMVTMITSKSDTWHSFMVFNFFVSTFADAGLLAPVDKYYDDPEIFLPTYTMPLKSAQDMLSYGGSTYGFPQVVVSEGLLRYRSDLIEQLLTDESWKAKYSELAMDNLGKELEPKQPIDWDWDDYLATAIFFTKKYNPDSPTEFGTVFEGLSESGVQFPAFFYEFLVSFGGTLVKDGKAVLNSDKGLQALSYLLDLRRKYEVVPADVHRYEAFEEVAAFQSGKVAMGLDWDWDTTYLASQDESPLIWDKMKETLPPKGPGGRAAYVQEFGWVINNYISEEAKNDMAKFLSFASSSKEGVLESLKVGIPAGVYVPELLTEEEGFSKTEIDHYNFYYNELLSGDEVQAVYWPLVVNAEQIYSTMAKTLGRALAGEIVYDEALNIMEKDINDALAK